MPIDTENPTGYQRLEDRASARAVLVLALREAHHELRLFDRDASYWDLDGVDFCTALSEFLREHAQSRATLVVHDADAIARHAVRLMAVAARFTPRLQIRETQPEIHSYAHGVVIVDRDLVLRRPHFDHGTAFLDRDPAAVGAAEHLFEDLLENSNLSPPIHTTGL